MLQNSTTKIQKQVTRFRFTIGTLTGCAWLWQVKNCNAASMQGNHERHGAVPSQSKISPRITLITRMVHEEMLPTKHTKDTNEAESVLERFWAFVWLVGKLSLHAG